LGGVTRPFFIFFERDGWGVSNDRSIIRNLFKVTLHLNNKNKKFPFYFVLSSICCNFAPANYNLIKVVFQLIKRLDYE